MAEIKITELPQAVSVGREEQFALVQEGVTKRGGIGLIIDAVIDAITGPGNPFIQDLTLTGNQLGITGGQGVELTASNMTGDGYNPNGTVTNETVQYWLATYGTRILSLENRTFDYLPINKAIVKNGPNYSNNVEGGQGSGLFYQNADTPDNFWSGNFGGMYLIGSSAGGTKPKIGVGVGGAVAGNDDDNLWWQARDGRERFQGASRQWVNSFGIGIGIAEESRIPYNSDVLTGVYVAQTDDPDRPPELTGISPFINLKYEVSTGNFYTTEIAARSTEGNALNYMGYRGQDQSGDWSDWVRLWDRSNMKSPYVESIQKQYTASDVSHNGIWNQWIEPLCVSDDFGNLWIGSVGSNSELYITKKSPDGNMIRRQIGSIRAYTDPSNISDDHNAPAILLDMREDAQYPIMIFQTDHNVTPMRYWRFTTLDINKWDINDFQDIGTENVGYTQVSRYNDEIFLWSRISPGSGGTLRPWRLAYSADNGGTWVTRWIFETSANWLYCLAKQKFDGSGLNIAMNSHPKNSTNQGIYFLELDYASGAVINPADRANPVIPDIRAAVNNPAFVPIDPYVVGLELRPTSGTEITRLWDVTRGNTGICRVLITVSPNADPTMQTFNDSYYRLISFNLANGTIGSTQNIHSAAIPVENNPRGQNFYFAGACFVGSNAVYLLGWRNESNREGMDDITYDYGRTGIRWIDVSNPSVPVAETIGESYRKLLRPYSPPRGNANVNVVLFNECEYYEEYPDFYSDIVIHDFNEEGLTNIPEGPQLTYNINGELSNEASTVTINRLRSIRINDANAPLDGEPGAISRSFVWIDPDTGFNAPDGAGIQVEQRISDTDRSGFRLTCESNVEPKPLFFIQKLRGDLTSWGPPREVLFKSLSEDIGTAAGINAGNIFDIKFGTASADKNYTINNMSEGHVIQTQIENTSAADITITFANANLVGGATGVIIANGYSIFTATQINGIISVTQV